MRKNALLILFLAGMLVFGTTAFAQEEPDPQEQDLEMLRLYYPDDYDRMIASATRFPKPKGKIAENITVIDKKEIEEMNAHTLADVLFMVPGVQISDYTGLGGLPTPNVQGSFMHHVPILIDGVRMNNLSNDTIDISAFPVQNIERIEIIKGPASSVWGSSIGGIINIITKDPSVRKLSGTLSASLGEKNTGDYRAEATGRINNFAYYLYGGYQNTNGTVNGFALNNENSFYTKLNYDLTSQLSVMFTFGHINENKATGEFSQSGWDEKNFWNYEYWFSTLQAEYLFSGDTILKLSLRTSRKNGNNSRSVLSTGEFIGAYPEHDKDTGATLLFSTKQGIHSVVFGADVDDTTTTTNYWTPERQDVKKHAVFVNDTVFFGKLTLTPGVRYDYVNSTGSIASPSLGATYKLTDRTLLRFFGAKGFSTPALSWIAYAGSSFHANPNLKYEKVLSVLAGIETSAIKYLHLNVNLFSHRVKDAIDYVSFDDGTWSMANKNRQKREGFEAELKTLPVYNTSLTAGICYINARDLNTGQRIMGVARYSYDIGLRYDDKKSLIALLKGHYIKWESDPSYNPRASFIWDFNISKRVYTQDKQNIELFASAHNIFNALQYRDDFYPNPKRWLEAGVRYKF